MNGWTNQIKGWLVLLGLMGAVGVCGEVLYRNDFQDATVGEEPGDFLVLDGDFVTKRDGDDRFLELPGTPLENFGALFGPTVRTGSRLGVTIQSQGKGRLVPAFGIGVNGLGGFRLMLSANRRQLELWRGDEVLVKTPYRWRSGSECRLELEAVPRADGDWQVRGWVWERSRGRQSASQIALERVAPPPRGKSSIWGHPFAGNAIRYDDILIETAELVPTGVAAGLRLGLQTWTVRNLSFDQMVSFAVAHGFEWLALSRTHMDPRASREETLRKKAVLEEMGLKAYTFGVARTSLDHEDNRRLFEFAKVMGIELIVVEPDDFEIFASLERLAKEYDVRVAIHNHGIRTLYGNPLVVGNVIKHLDERIGVCLDTGWVTASGFDPARVFKDYSGRVFDVHLKDKRTERTQGDDVFFDTYIGDGEGRLEAFVRLLKEQKFDGVMALETDSPSFAREPEAFVRRGKEFVQRVMTEGP